MAGFGGGAEERSKMLFIDRSRGVIMECVCR